MAAREAPTANPALPHPKRPRADRRRRRRDCASRSCWTPDITMEEVIRAAFPYVVFGLVMLTLIFFIPGIATWLPSVVSP